MRILFISHFFPPEEPPAAFLAFEFAKKMVEAGHDVDVLTGFPNWPSGRVLPGYDSRKMSIEDMDGIRVCRVPFFPAPKGGFIKRALDFKSFHFSVKWYGRKLSRPNLIYVLVPPNEDGIAARYLAKYFNCPYVLNVQDIHPDTAINLGFVKNPLLIYMLKRQERKMYHGAAHVVVIGSRMKKMLVDKGIPSNRVSVLPNWINSDTVVPGNKVNALRKEWGIANDVFVVLYAGTFGRIHGTSTLLDVANRLQDENILFLLVGQGYDFDKLAHEVDAREASNILVKPFVPRSSLSKLQALADISIVLTKSGFGLTSVPSKVLGYMAASRPILAAVDAQSDTACLILAANAGMVVRPESDFEIASALVTLLNQPDDLKQWGINARKYVIKYLSPSEVLAKGVGLLESIVVQAQE